MILIGHDDAVAKWVGEKSGKMFHPPFKAIGVIDREGTLVGGYVFTGYNGDGIEVSLAGRGSMSKEGWRAVLAYVFGQLRCVRLQMHTSEANKKMKRFLGRNLPRRCFEGIARRFYGRDDAVCFALTVNDLPAFRAKWRI